MALPTAVFAMVASFALASAAVMASVDSQRGTARDRNSKDAIAAADAGASLALLRLNRFQKSLSSEKPCVGPNGETQTPSAGWCPASATESVNGATFYYYVSAFKANSELTVVAVGTAGNVSRRVEVGLVTHNEENVFAGEQLIGEDEIQLDGTAVEINTDIGTNGNVDSNGHATVCGDLRHGIGKESPPEQPQCGGELTEGNIELPPIAAPEDIETNNSNCRLAVTCPDPENPNEIDPSQVDTYAKGPHEKETRNATEPWDSETRTINVGSNATLTMSGENYFVCKIDLKGQLIMAAESHIRIYVDTPEHCGLEPGATQVEMEGHSSIVSTGFIVDEESYSLPEIYVMGESTVKLGGTADADELLLYAPYSDVSISGNATWTGLLAGKTMTLNGSPTVEEYPGPPPKGLNFTSLWERTHYVECTGGTGSPPNASC